MKREFVKAKLHTEGFGEYGIEADLGEGEVKIYQSLAMKREEVESLVRMINRGAVSSLHIDEIIEDFLA